MEARYKEAGKHVDGLLHGPNGAEHPEGGLVSGVNQLIKKNNQQQLFDINQFENMQEIEEHQAEIRNARVQAVKNEKMRQIEAAKAQQARAQREQLRHRKLN